MLPHWTPSVNARFPSVGTRHAPPEVLHSPYYPARGPYSSTNLTTLREHMREIRSIGDGTGDDNGVVVVVSWWGRASLEGTADTQVRAWRQLHLATPFHTRERAYVVIRGGVDARA